MSLVIESGFWFIESGVSIHPVELVVYQHPASVSILPDCVISILVSFLLVVVHPVCVVHSRYWFAVGILSRRSKPVVRSL